MSECVYCQNMVTTNDPPPAWDNEAWHEIAKEHKEDCEWVQTRAHRVITDEDRVHYGVQ